MEPFGRQPPRFVPTLTDVVPEGLPLQKPAQPQEPVLEDWVEPQAQTWETPVREPAALQRVTESGADAPSEPTLEPFATAQESGADAVPPASLAPESFDPAWDREDADAGIGHLREALGNTRAEAQIPDAMPPPALDAAALHELLVERILARVQPQLEAQLREVVADVVSMHAQAMARSLHGAVEDVVQHAVADAIAQEQIQTQLGIAKQVFSDRNSKDGD